MAAKLAEPTIEYLTALKAELQVQYRDQDLQIDRARSVREQTNLIPIPDDWKLVQIQVRDPTISDEAQRIAATFTVNPATLKVTPAGPGDSAQKNATLREEWTQNILEQAGSRIPGLHTFSALADATVADGGGWSKFTFSRDLWDTRYALRPHQFTDDAMTVDEDGKPKGPGETKNGKYLKAIEKAKQQAGSPFLWSPVDVLSFYPVWSGVKLSAGLEITKRPLSHTFRQYRLTTDRNGDIVPDELGQGQNLRQPIQASNVEFYEYWDEEWACFAVIGHNLNGDTTGQILRTNGTGREMCWRHGYQRVPYFFAPGLQMNHWRNRKVGWGVSEAKRSMVELYSFLMTLAAQAVARDTFASYQRTIIDPAAPLLGNDGQPRKNETMLQNVIYDVPQGGDIRPIVPPPVADSFKFLIPMVKETIQKLDSPRAGDQIGGIEASGFAINQVLAFERVRHAPIAQNIERHHNEVTEFMWYLTTKKVKERIWVYGTGQGKDAGWKSAGPEDLTETVHLEWSLNPEMPSDLLIKQRELIEGLQAGLIGPDAAIEELGRNPDEVRDDIMLNKIRQSPEYQKLLEGEVLQAIGRGDMLQQAASAQQIAQTGQVPGQVNPAMGSQGIPDMGQLAGSPGGGGMAPARPPMPGAGPNVGQPAMSVNGGAAGAGVP